MQIYAENLCLLSHRGGTLSGRGKRFPALRGNIRRLVYIGRRAWYHCMEDKFQADCRASLKIKREKGWVNGKMIVKNGKVFDENFDLKKTDVSVRNGRIAEIGPDLGGGESLDVSGLLVAPGFIDIHIHGCAGADTGDGTREAISAMAAHLVTNGVTSFCPTTTTLPEETIMKALAAARDCVERPPEGAAVRGVDLEGPFISPRRAGAQKSEYIRKPDAGLFRRMYERSGGIIKLVDIAPEVEGADEFIREVRGYCRVSFAHSTADYDQAKRAFSLGVTHVTHLFNAMTGLSHRAPGAVGAVFDSGGVAAEIICDGFHIHPAVLRVAFRTLGEDRTVVISDSMRAAGLADGDFDLGDQMVRVRDGHALLPDGTIAGSTTNLGAEVKNLVGFGVPVRQVIKSATINPAREIGADREVGSIAVGKRADFTVLDPDFNLRYVIENGRIVFRA